MEVLYPRYAGLDVHKDSVVAGVRLATDGPAKTEVRGFDTTTPGLLALSIWLAESGCTQVAMEATGVYWKRVWHILACRSAWKRLWRKVGAAIWHFLWSAEQTRPQQVELGPSIHLPFDQLQPGVLPLGLPVRPRLLQGGVV